MWTAKYIEHTVLSPIATVEDIINACQEVQKYGFFGICVNSNYVALAANLLSGTKAKVVSTCAFPLGAVRTDVKVFEALKIVEDKADEIDMVMNLAAAKVGNWQAVTDDIRAVVEACKIPVKVIIEVNILNDNEKVLATRAVIDGGAFCVKTCTGGMLGGATVSDVALLKDTAEGKIKIKASGGIRTHTQVVELINAGADRIGTSSAVLFMSVADNE